MTWHADAEADQPTSGGAPPAPLRAPRHEERPFAYLLDPTTPSAGDIGVEYRLGLASGVSAERPLPQTNAGAEGGARHFVGPNLALDVLDKKIAVVASIARYIGLPSPPVMGTVAVLTVF